MIRQIATLLLLVVSSSGNAVDDCTASIKNGTVTGESINTPGNPDGGCVYLGIPFALPPVGQLRFQPPQPAQSFGHLNATRYPPVCPQAPNGLEASEDCLYLNVYQPKNTTADANLPVMIWIHGGGFITGSSILYPPTRLLSRGAVILVVLQYRLGLLGFLSTADSLCPGNNGLKDQQLGIRWVIENIREFGGNPEKITLFGESAGGTSVSYQLLSPLNKELLSGAIIQSYSAIGVGSFDPNPVDSAKIMATRLDCPNSSSQEIVDCLKVLNWEKIIEEQTKFVMEAYSNLTHPLATITPVVEPDLPEAFIIEDPLNILEEGELDTDIPVMLGATKHDGSYFLGVFYMDYFGARGFDKDPEYMRNQIIPDILKNIYKIEGDIKGNRALASSIELAYLDGVNRSSWEESMPGLVDLFTVFSVKSQMLNAAELLSKRGVKVYLYSFEHHSENTFFPYFFPGVDIPVQGGITHIDDLIYLFELPIPTQFSPEDQSFSDKMCDMWINFATFGNPTPSKSERWDNWAAYDGSNELYMKLNGTPTVLEDYRSSWRPNGFEWN